MADDKYFYLMLKENFYDTDDIKLLEAMDNGYLYSNILLKLYLKSLEGRGKLMYKNRIPYNSQMLATLTRHNPDVVEKAIQVFVEMGIIEVLDNGAIYMLDIENLIGKSSTRADRQRMLDRRISEEKKALTQHIVVETESEQKSDRNLTEICDHINTNLYTNTEIDIDTDTHTHTNGGVGVAEPAPEPKPKPKPRKKAAPAAGAEKSDFEKAIDGFIEMRKKIKKPLTDRALQMIRNKLNELAPGDEATQILILDASTEHCWQSVYPLKDDNWRNRGSPPHGKSKNPFARMLDEEGDTNDKK